MKIRGTHLSYLVCAAILLSAHGVGAQSTGAVTGTVVDAESGDPLEGVNVTIAALNLVAVSDAAGRFTIHDVPAGTHQLGVQLIGYAGEPRTITVTAGATLTVALSMDLSLLYMDELVVTGTAFKESPINQTYAVVAVGREEMAEQGSPQAVDFFKNLGASHGVIGERSSWYNSGQAATLTESIANVNLRGLGASRTLVLINSRRQTYVPARLIGGRFVDVNVIPSIAIERVEVLKEGASAIYGSDAVGGVANFLTRRNFEGFEVSAAHEYFPGRGRYQRRRDMGRETRRSPRGRLRRMEGTPGVAVLGKGLPAAAMARWRAAPGVVEPGQSRHLRHRGAGPMDRRHSRPKVRGIRWFPGVLDVPVPISAI